MASQEQTQVKYLKYVHLVKYSTWLNVFSYIPPLSLAHSPRENTKARTAGNGDDNNSHPRGMDIILLKRFMNNSSGSKWECGFQVCSVAADMAANEWEKHWGLKVQLNPLILLAPFLPLNLKNAAEDGAGSYRVHGLVAMEGIKQEGNTDQSDKLTAAQFCRNTAASSQKWLS